MLPRVLENTPADDDCPRARSQPQNQVRWPDHDPSQARRPKSTCRHNRSPTVVKAPEYWIGGGIYPAFGVRRLVAAFAFAPRILRSHQVLTLNSANPPSRHNTGSSVRHYEFTIAP